MKLTGTGVLAVASLAAGVVGLVIAWPKLRELAAVAATKINPNSRENVVYQATGEVGTRIPDWFNGFFKSNAEREVDKMLGKTKPASAPAPSRKEVITPADFVPRGYYDLGQKPVPVGAARVINQSGTLTDSAYRDMVR